MFSTLCSLSSTLTIEEDRACRDYVVDSRLIAGQHLFNLNDLIASATPVAALNAVIAGAANLSETDKRMSVRQLLGATQTEVQTTSQRIASAIAKSRLAKPCLVYAGHGDVSSIFGSFMPNATAVSSLLGHRYRYSGFISTTTDKDKARDISRARTPLSLLLEFELETGHKALDMSQFVGVGGGEFELLLHGGDFTITAALVTQLRRLGRSDMQNVLCLTLAD